MSKGEKLISREIFLITQCKPKTHRICMNQFQMITTSICYERLKSCCKIASWVTIYRSCIEINEKVANSELVESLCCRVIIGRRDHTIILHHERIIKIPSCIVAYKIREKCSYAINFSIIEEFFTRIHNDCICFFSHL